VSLFRILLVLIGKVTRTIDRVKIAANDAILWSQIVNYLASFYYPQWKAIYIRLKNENNILFYGQIDYKLMKEAYITVHPWFVRCRSETKWLIKKNVKKQSNESTQTEIQTISFVVVCIKVKRALVYLRIIESRRDARACVCVEAQKMISWCRVHCAILSLLVNENFVDRYKCRSMID